MLKLRLPILAGIAALSFGGCTGERDDPLDLARRLDSFIAESSAKQSALEERCMRMQGVDRPKADPDPISIRSTVEIPAATYLLQLTDEELLRLVRKDQPSELSPPSEVAKFRYEVATVDGSRISGGCSVWAERSAYSQIEHYEFARKLIAESANAGARSERAELAPFVAKWKSCLSVDARGWVDANRVVLPAMLPILTIQEATSAIENASEISEIRSNLKALEARQRKLMLENKRCTDAIDFTNVAMKARAKAVDRMFESAQGQRLKARLLND